MKSAVICPRCGEPVSYFSIERKGGREYVYAVHYYRERGKRKKRKCYLGPLGHYEYVTRTHLREGLILKGMHKSERLLEYLKTLARALEHVSPEKINRRELEYIAETLYRISVKLKQIAKRREK